MRFSSPKMHPIVIMTAQETPNYSRNLEIYRLRVTQGHRKRNHRIDHIPYTTYY